MYTLLRRAQVLFLKERDNLSKGPAASMNLGDVALPAFPSMPLNGLVDLSRAVTRAERLQHIYEAAIHALCSSIGADRASVLLFDESDVMRFVAWRGLSDEYRAAVEGHSPWTRETADPKPIFVDDIDADEALRPYRETIKGEGIIALGFIPLLYGTKLLGKFMVYFDSVHQFTEQESLLLETIANHIAFAIEKRRSEEGLSLYRQIFEHSLAGIGVIDLDGCYVEQNRAHAAMIGYEIEELTGKTPAIHLGQEVFDEVAAKLKSGETFRGEVVSTTKEGVKKDMDLSAFLVRDPDGKPRFFVGMKKDISVRKQALKEVRRLNLELEERVAERTAELQRAKDEMEGFCYSVSHDLRAPLRGMMSAAMMLIEDYGDNLSAEAQDHLHSLAKASNRMAQLIDDLLQYSRLGRKELAREAMDLSESARRLAAGRPIEVAGSPMVRVDSQLMDIVLQNLLDNAFKFSAGRQDPRVEFGFSETSGAYYVRDNGVGFDPKYMDKLFRPFERLHLESEFPGTGIGLANVKRIVERHGGRIWAESEVGKGATFYFTIG
jgi:PAS domain S-box-containing protein